MTRGRLLTALVATVILLYGILNRSVVIGPVAELWRAWGGK